MAHIEEKYHNNSYFQTLFVRFALDWIGKNIYFLSLKIVRAKDFSPYNRATTREGGFVTCPYILRVSSCFFVDFTSHFTLP